METDETASLYDTKTGGENGVTSNARSSLQLAPESYKMSATEALEYH